MATHYLDLVNGNNSNGGTSFADAKLNFAGITSGLTAPGDTIKILKSADPVSTGISGTFTNKSATISVSMAASHIEIDDCDSAFTAAANVTATAASGDRKEGTNAASLAIASGFTTGLIAYKATGTLDLSTLQQVSFWIKANANVAANTLSLKLCSDAAGATPVDTLAITHNLISGRWYPLAIDKGSALGSAIQSVALYADLDPGTVTILLDNIFATTSPATGSAITLRSLVSKTGELPYTIRSITPSAIMLESGANNPITTTVRGYSGVTESVTIYRRECVVFNPADTSTAWGAPQESGSSGNLITYSGGWADASTQDGYTYVDGTTGQVNGITTGLAFLKFERLVFVRFDRGFNFSGPDLTLSDIGSVGCTSNAILYTSDRLTCTGEIFATVTNTGPAIDLRALNMCLENVKCLSANGVGVSLGNTPGSTLHTGTITSNNSSSNGLVLANAGHYNEVISSDNVSLGVDLSSMIGEVTINSLSCVGNASSALRAFRCWLTINNLTTSGNSNGIDISSLTANSRIIVKNSSYDEATFLSGTITPYSGSRVQLENEDGVSGAHRTVTDGGTIASETGSDRDTASGLAWKLSPTSTSIRHANYPLRLCIGRRYVVADNLVTVTARVKRKSVAAEGLTIVSRIIAPRGQLAGMTTDYSDDSSAADNTYETLSFTFTPTAAGVFEVFFDAWGTTTQSAFVDNATITQAE